MVKKLFKKFKSLFGVSDYANKIGTNSADQINDEQSGDKKFESVYYNLPVGMVTISHDDWKIQNYNSIFSSLLSNFFYPHGVGKYFSDLVFKTNKDAFITWISQNGESEVTEGLEIKLIRDKMGVMDIPILEKINKLFFSERENIIVLSVINIDTYLNEDLRLEEEKYLLEKNNCAKNKILIETFAELKNTLTKFVGHGEKMVETDRLKHILIMVEKVLDYYDHNTNTCLYCATGQEAEHEVASRIRKKFDNVRILIVDDMDINLDIISDMLNDFIPTATVDKARNGQEALELIEYNEYDIILMDLFMPIMDGYETIERLREDVSDDKTKELPIVVLTSLSHKSDKDRALAIGVNDYLTKPVNPRELIRVLEKWI